MTDSLDLTTIEARLNAPFSMWTHPYGDEQSRKDCLALVAEVKRLTALQSHTITTTHDHPGDGAIYVQVAKVRSEERRVG